jgi:hypothetical protein
MIPPTPGADPASRRFGYATPPDGAGPIGPDGYWPQPIDVPFSDVLKAMNPLHHVPVVGTIYRAITGETIPAPLRILGAGIFGGPIGILGAALMGFAEALLGMAPDRSRPSVPLGMSETGSEAPMGAVTPGTVKPGEYTTLATTVPEFLQSPTQFAAADQQRGLAAYQTAAQEWQWSQRIEKGLA